MKDVTVAGGVLRHYHVAAFVRSREEEFKVLRSYILDGIHAGEKTIHICDPKLQREHLRDLEKIGVPIADCTRTGQLEVLSWEDAYLKDNRFDPDTMMALIEEMVNTSQAEGFPRVRLLGHTEWALEDRPGVDRFFEYESRVNEVLNRRRHPAICVYDVNRFSASAILDLLKTHPYVVIDGKLRENTFYVPPEELIGALAEPPSPP
jgi:hypothetical protein